VVFVAATAWSIRGRGQPATRRSPWQNKKAASGGFGSSKQQPAWLTV
jgi:hypothetical protein